MTSTQPVWISTQAYERLQRELATLRELYTSASADGDTDENSDAVRHGGRHGFNRFMTCWSTPPLARTHPTTESPNPAWC